MAQESSSIRPVETGLRIFFLIAAQFLGRAVMMSVCRLLEGAASLSSLPKPDLVKLEAKHGQIFE